MNDFDPKRLQKLKKLENLENLEEIEAQLAREERKARITLVGGIVLAVLAFAVLLGCILNPAWIPHSH